MHRAYSLLTLKSVDEEQRIITGIASTPTPDRVGDIVEPKGAQFKLPIPLLWQHRSAEPIGEVFAAKITSEGIEIQARVAKIHEPGKLKDRVDEAWQSIKAKLVRGLSIGFKELESARIKDTYAYHHIKWLWLELSAVTIPANAEATIQSVKHFDIEPAASGTELAGESTKKAGASASTRVVKARTEKTMKKTLTEQISAFEATRQSKNARMDEIMEGAADKGETLDAASKEEYDGLEAEVKEIDEHITRLRAAEKRAMAAAKPVDGTSQKAASESRGAGIITVKDNLPPGVRFARLAMIVGRAKGINTDALHIAKAMYPDETRIHEFIEKAAVGGATTANGQGPLLQYTDITSDFVEYLRPKTIVGKFGTNGIPSLRRVPFNVRVSTQTVGGSAYWVGEGKPKPLTKGTFSTITVDFNKVATIAVLTKEEVRFASPSAELKVRDDLAAAVAARIDIDFVNPAKAAVAGVSPASITNGVVATAVSGTDADAVRVDFKNMMSGLIAAEIEPDNGVLIMSTTMALNLSLMLNALGQREFPDLSMKGGFLFGFPVIVSEYMTSYGSPSTQMIIFVNASDIYLADDGGVTVDVSDQASLEMLDGSLQQDGTAGTGASLVSLWQTNMIGLRAEREITWKKRRSAAVAYLSPVAYTPTT